MNNNIKQSKKTHRLVFEMWLSKKLHNMLVFSQNVQGRSRDKQVYDIVADDYGILWIIESEQIKFTWNTRTVNWCESSH